MRTTKLVEAPTRPRIRVTMLACAAMVAWALSAGDAGAQDRPLGAELAEVYRVGGLNAPEWAEFVNPVRMGFDDSGNLYVLDDETYQVVVIDPGGNLVRTVGGRGRGRGSSGGRPIWWSGATAASRWSTRSTLRTRSSGRTANWSGSSG